MSEGLFAGVELGTAGRAGFRLHHVEVFNWGTFDRRVWRLEPGGETSLLTGDIGSGKSTLVDAVTTLLLPAQRIAYNKAAGAEAKERTLRSYVEGHYKSERHETSGTTRAVGLRGDTAYSVVLGVFANEGYDETVTLAQVFQQRDRAGQPDRFFVTAPKALSVEADFTDFGSDLRDLRSRLRGAGASVETVFPDYARRFHRLLGIESAQAMELFGQTVSMKSVGNLNEFVRQHMLEPVDAADRISGIVAHFEDLTKAHEAVTRARQQLEALAPLVETITRYDAGLAHCAEAERQRDAVRLFVAETRIGLVTDEIAAHRAERGARRSEADDTAAQLTELTTDRETLITARAGAGGDRVGQLEQEAARAHAEAQARRQRRTRLDERTGQAGVPPVTDATGLAALAGRLPGLVAEAETQRAAADQRFVELKTRGGEIERGSVEIRSELTSLAGRTSNLPSAQLEVRAALCEELGIDQAALPFAGELLDVSADHGAWRGAAERVLRGFALSLLVPDDHYAAVADWVNGRRLVRRRHDGGTAGMRLVYERVAPRRIRSEPHPYAGGLVLADCLEVKAGPFADYLRGELARRADHRCAQSVADFRAERKAVTREGQVRSGDRHEKDDRSRVDDPRSWVLGWVNERKIAALTDQLGGLQTELLALTGELEEVDTQRESVRLQHQALSALTEYDVWADVDPGEAEQRAAAAEAEVARLVSGSSELAEIERRLDANAAEAARLNEQADRLRGEVGRLDERISRATETLQSDEQLVAGTASGELAAARAAYDVLRARLPTPPARSADCQASHDRLAGDLQSELDRVTRDLQTQSSRMVTQMNAVLNAWPETRNDMDAHVGARAAYVDFHGRVADDDLPRFEADFKTQLNTNTIRELAGFNAWLNRQAEEIDARVGLINDAMGAIDYSPGRYIRLEKQRTTNSDVDAFRGDLRAATTDVTAPDEDHYTEQRFADVQRLIERFRGRTGFAESDKTWTRRVTDVRNWFTFSASERDRETDVEWEHYNDSDGKSGGQKEKLAYTILAASLAYQFKLEWGARRSRDFRFAVIDEAFGRGSDASTRYALELFAKLGLQLLIVTPLQKVHVIEPHVRAIGFVDNPSGSYSRLQTLTIEEFRDLRDGRAG